MYFNVGCVCPVLSLPQNDGRNTAKTLFSIVQSYKIKSFVPLAIKEAQSLRTVSEKMYRKQIHLLRTPSVRVHTPDDNYICY